MPCGKQQCPWPRPRAAASAVRSCLTGRPFCASASSRKAAMRFGGADLRGRRDRGQARRFACTETSVEMAGPAILLAPGSRNRVPPMLTPVHPRAGTPKTARRCRRSSRAPSRSCSASWTRCGRHMMAPVSSHCSHIPERKSTIDLPCVQRGSVCPVAKPWRRRANGGVGSRFLHVKVQTETPSRGGGCEFQSGAPSAASLPSLAPPNLGGAVFSRCCRATRLPRISRRR